MESDSHFESMANPVGTASVALSAARALEQSQQSQVRFPKLRQVKGWSSPAEVRQLGWRDEWLARALQTIIFGFMAATIGFVTFSTHFIGTWPELVGAFFWAYAFDFSAGMLTDRISSAP